MPLSNPWYLHALLLFVNGVELCFFGLFVSFLLWFWLRLQLCGLFLFTFWLLSLARGLNETITTFDNFILSFVMFSGLFFGVVLTAYPCLSHLNHLWGQVHGPGRAGLLEVIDYQTVKSWLSGQNPVMVLLWVISHIVTWKMNRKCVKFNGL